MGYFFFFNVWDLVLYKLHAQSTQKKDWDKNLHMGLLFLRRRDPAAQSELLYIF